MDESELIKFLRDNIEPLENTVYGKGYRASVYLSDGTFLPCVTFRSSKNIVDLAVRRFKEEKSAEGLFSRKHGFGYKEIVKNFVAKGNCINHYDIKSVTESRFAFPLRVQEQIRGETAMSWTAFVARFDDGRLLSFATSWNWEFFDVPENYNLKNSVEIINNSYIHKAGQILHHSQLKGEKPFEDLELINREKPFFECFLDNL